VWVEVATDHPDLVFTDETITEDDTYKYAVEAVFPGGLVGGSSFL